MTTHGVPSPNEPSFLIINSSSQIDLSRARVALRGRD